MVKSAQRTVSQQLQDVPSSVRPIVRSAREVIRDVAPDAEEVAYRGTQPRSASMMWKLARYRVDGKDVVGFGTFTKHSALFFYRGRELPDPSGLLQGSGKDSRFVTLRTPADARTPAVKRLLREAFKLSTSTRQES